MLTFILITPGLLLTITVHRTSLLQYAIRIAGPLLWNSLDSNRPIKSVASLNTFRRKLKNLLYSQLDS